MTVILVLTSIALFIWNSTFLKQEVHLNHLNEFDAATFWIELRVSTESIDILTGSMLFVTSTILIIAEFFYEK